MPPRSMPDESPERFLAELRALRDHAGIDHAELATRAHYPVEVLTAAEAGPFLPELPVLAAYVRGCGGVPAEWEERWRLLTGSPADSGLPMRPVGGSAAAEAGARAGAAAMAADDHDPARIMAVLSRASSAGASSTGGSTPGGSGSGSRAGPASGLDLGPRPGLGAGGAAGTGARGASGGAGAPSNGYWRSAAHDADPGLAEVSQAMLPSPVPVPSSPPPVPSPAPARPPFMAPEWPAASSPGHPGTSPGRVAHGGHGSPGQAPAVVDMARDLLDRSTLTPGALSLVVVVVLVLAGILVALLS